MGGFKNRESDYYKIKASIEPVLIYLIVFQPGCCRTILLVEGCLYAIPEMKNWDLFCSILLESKEDLNMLEAVAVLFYESVKQTLAGKSSKLREKSRISK